MPNWCENTLTVSGQAADLAAFDKWLGDQPLTMERVKPMPKELEDTVPLDGKDPASKEKLDLVSKYGHSNWYDWRVANWGSKWDVEMEKTASSESSIVFEGQSAWGPIVSGATALSALFPSLVFFLEYCELGAAFAGNATMENGDCEDVCFSADDDEAAYKNYVSERWEVEFNEEETADSN